MDLTIDCVDGKRYRFKYKRKLIREVEAVLKALDHAAKKEGIMEFSLDEIRKGNKPKPVFLVKKIEGENLEEICDGIWGVYDEEEKLEALRRMGHEIN